MTDMFVPPPTTGRAALSQVVPSGLVFIISRAVKDDKLDCPRARLIKLGRVRIDAVRLLIWDAKIGPIVAGCRSWIGHYFGILIVLHIHEVNKLRSPFKLGPVGSRRTGSDMIITPDTDLRA